MGKMNYKSLSGIKKVVAIATTLAVLCGMLSFLFPIGEVRAEDKYPIMGPSNVTVGQLMNYYNSKAKYPSFYAEAGSDAPTLDAFCQIFVEESNAEGVRVEVVFCQAMKETGFLKFGGAVDIAAYNFAGIGAVDSSPGSYNWFPDVRTGVRAQVQHLKAYASTANLNNECVDPRFHLVSRGCAPYVEDLGGKWASGDAYGYSIRDEYMAKLGTFNGFTTIYNGVDYSAVYDPNYYLDHYSDVRAAYANDGYALVTHYATYGVAEGRKANDYFDPYVYKSNYVDLRNEFGHNIGSYIIHYILCGQAEGRQGLVPNGSTDRAWRLNGVDYSSVYNYNHYVTANPDVTQVIGTDDIDVLNHFVNYGMSEGRSASLDFDYKSYMNEYPDLRAQFRYDKRPYYEHYINCGKAEGRHGTGCNERKGAVTRILWLELDGVYNYDYYIAHNPDVAAVVGNDDIATLDHFINYGMSEARQAADYFNVWAYAFNNPDLVNAFGMNLSEYYIHYAIYGRNEGRIAV